MQLVSATVALKDMLLDPNNPRIRSLNNCVTVSLEHIGEPDVQEQILQKLNSDKTYGISELQVSIARNGLVPVENIIVTRHADGKYLVVEGNRRIAAVKQLLEGVNGSLYNLTSEKKGKLAQIEVKVVEKEHPEEDILQFVRLIQGLRHISGTKEWEAFQKAWFTCTMKEAYGMSLSDITALLGLEQRVVSRYYKTYKALMQMKDDPNFGRFAEARLFTYFEELLENIIIQKWLDWDNDHLKFKNTPNLQTMYSLLSGGKGESQPAQCLKSHRDIRSFGKILSKEKLKENFLAGNLSLHQALTLGGQPIKPWQKKALRFNESLGTLGEEDVRKMNHEDIALLKTAQRLIISLLKTASDLGVMQ
jgi:hypothetical protein